jgi:hypothetical protein
VGGNNEKEEEDSSKLALAESSEGGTSSRAHLRQVGGSSRLTGMHTDRYRSARCLSLVPLFTISFTFFYDVEKIKIERDVGREKERESERMK